MDRGIEKRLFCFTTQHKGAFTSIVRLQLIAQESPLSVCKMPTVQTNDKS